MKTLCVVTAVKNGNFEWLEVLGRSLAEIKLPEGWNLVWSVQDDAGGSLVDGEALVRNFPFCRYESLGEGFTVGAARNVAFLKFPDCDAVTCFDADDIAGPGLGTSLRILEEEPDIGWVSGPVQDFREDGTPVPFSQVLAGRVEPGVVPGMWWERQRLPFHTIGFVSRADIWRALGGWQATPSMSDSTATVMAVCQLFSGFVHGDVVGWWRRHPKQVSFSDKELRLQSVSWDMIRERVASMRRLGWGP